MQIVATIDRTALSRDVFLTFSGTSRTIRMVFRSNLENGSWAALGKPRAALGALGSSLAGQGLLWELSEVQLYKQKLPINRTAAVMLLYMYHKRNNQSTPNSHPAL